MKRSQIKEMNKVANDYKLDLSRPQSRPVWNRPFGVDALLNKWNNALSNGQPGFFRSHLEGDSIRAVRCE